MHLPQSSKTRIQRVGSLPEELEVQVKVPTGLAYQAAEAVEAVEAAARQPC